MYFLTTLLTTLSRLITENTENTEIKVHQNSPQRPDIRSNQLGTWSGNNTNVLGQPLASSQIPKKAKFCILSLLPKISLKS